MGKKTSKNDKMHYQLYKTQGKWLDNKVKKAERHMKSHPNDAQAGNKLEHMGWSGYNRNRRSAGHTCKVAPAFADTPAVRPTIVDQFVALGFKAPPPRRKKYYGKKSKNTPAFKAG
jgi:hypothetical protein